jgi:hypothetical protein
VADSAIAPEVAEARGYRSVETKADLEHLGFSRAQRQKPALLIPIWDTRGEIATYQSRPNTPRIRNGKAVKYETPSGTRMVIDVPPSARPNLTDPTTSLFVTEGVRKADAAVSRGLCCIDVLGVWNWRGTNGHGGKVALPDWESIALNERKVYLCFDSDAMTKPEVYGALARLKSFLESRGAHVHVIYLPASQNGGKVGLDDFLAAGGTVDDLLSRASNTLREPPHPTHDGTDGTVGPYRETENGIVWVKATRDGTTEVRLTNFTAKIVADISEDDGVEVVRRFEMDATLNGGRAPRRHRDRPSRVRHQGPCTSRNPATIR